MDKNLLVLLAIIPFLIIGGDIYLNSKQRDLQIVSLNSGIQEKTDKISEANEAKQRLPVMQESIKKLKSKYDEVIRALPTTYQAEILIKQSIPIADKWLQFTELSPMTKTKSKMSIKISSVETKVDYEEIKMKMTIKSSFSKLGQYLQELENIQMQNVRKLVEVSSLDIKTDTISEQLQVSMEVKTYTFPEK